MPTTICVFEFDVTGVHAIRRCPPPTLCFNSTAPGARMDYDLSQELPAGTYVEIITSVVDISGVAPGLFFVGGGVQTATDGITAAGDDQSVNMTLTEPCSQIQEHAVTYTLASWSKVKIMATLPE